MLITPPSLKYLQLLNWVKHSKQYCHNSALTHELDTRCCGFCACAPAASLPLPRMVRTRSRASFSHDYPVFSALAKRDHERLTALLSEPGAATTCGPGGITPLHASVLLADATSIQLLVAAGAPLETKLTLSANDGELANWLNLLALESGRERGWRQGDIHCNDTPIFLAARVSAPNNRLVGKALLEAGACPWSLFKPYTFSSYSHQIPHHVATWLVPLIAARYEAGQLELSAEQLHNLVDAAISTGGLDLTGSILSVLRMAVARQQPRLGTPEANALLLRAVDQGSAAVVSLLLQLGASATASRYGTSAANLAADRAHQAVLKVLLEAGAPVSPQLVRSVIHGLRPGLLEVLLQHGPIPIDSSSAKAVGGYWTCPVLCLLSIKPRVSQKCGRLPCLAPGLACTVGRLCLTDALWCPCSIVGKGT